MQKHKVIWHLTGRFPAGNLRNIQAGLHPRPMLGTAKNSITTSIELDKDFDSNHLWTVLRSFWNDGSSKISDCESLRGELQFGLWSPNGYIEAWGLKGTRPIQIDFGEMGHSHSDLLVLEIKWRYDEIVRLHPLPEEADA